MKEFPANLTPTEVKVVESVIRVGCHKLVARDLGMAHRTAECHLYRARQKSGDKCTLHLALRYLGIDYKQPIQHA